MESYVVLARRYRPRTFHEVLGQESIARTLVHAIQTGRVAHAYLFSGSRGIGKTSMARILSKALCCLSSEGPTPEPCDKCDLCLAVSRGEDIDVIEIDGASNRGIEEIRTLRDNALYTPARARLKIYIIDEVHMLTPQAFNALLKTLEEPPSHVKFIFATTEPHKVPATILSRCQRFDFRRIPNRIITAHLRQICTEEKVEAAEDVLLSVAQASEGGMRDAQSLLDQLITLGQGKVLAENLESLLGTVSAGRMEELLRAVGAGDDGKAIALFEQVYDRGVDPAEFLGQVMETSRDLLVLLTCGPDTDLLDLTADSLAALVKIAEQWGKPRVLYALGLLSETLKTVKLVGEGRALVELALAKIAGAGRLRSLDEVLRDLEELGVPATGSPAPVARATGENPGGRKETHSGSAVAEAPRDSELFQNRVPEGVLRGEETGTLTVERLRELWPEVLSRVHEHSSAVGAFLASGRVLGLSAETVELGFPQSARFHQAQLKEPERIRSIEAEIEAVTGRPLRLKTTVTDAAVEEKEEEQGAGEPEQVTREELDKIGRQPVVNALKDLFQARLTQAERI